MILGGWVFLMSEEPLYEQDGLKADTRPLEALTPNTVELIPTLGALSPRGGPVQDPFLTRGAHP